MLFEWDERKAALNASKHGVPFPYAVRVFLDPHRLDAEDTRRQHGEPRHFTLGKIEGRLYAVAYTMREPLSALFRRAKLTTANGDNTMKQYRLDPKKPRKLTTSEARRLDAAPIDYSDIPPLGDEFFKRVTAALPDGKEQLTVRIDADILKWLKATGRGYHTRINRILRAAMEGHPSRTSPRSR